MPTARDPWSLLSQAPGVLVDRFNLGGNESGQQSNFLGTGSTGRDNVFAVDGVVLTDMNAVGASATYFDFGAFEEVQFTVSSADVTVATAGRHHQPGDQARHQRVARPGALPAHRRRLAVRPVELGDGLIGNQIDAVEEYGADIGGPLWKDHLWIWASYGESDISNIVPSAARLDTTQLEDLNTKLNFQAGQQQLGRAPLLDQRQAQVRPRRRPDPGARRRPSTRPRRRTSTRSRTPGSRPRASSSPACGRRDDGIFTLRPAGRRSTPTCFTRRGRRAARHQLRLHPGGGDRPGAPRRELLLRRRRRPTTSSSSAPASASRRTTPARVWPRGKFVVAGEFQGLDPGIGAWSSSRATGRWASISSYDSAWLQDTITLDRWTINAGLRYDKQTLREPGELRSGQPAGGQGLLPPLNFPGNDAGGFEWETVVPARRRHLRPGRGPQDPAARHLLAVRRAARPAPAGHPRQPDRLRLRLLLLRGRQRQPGLRSERGRLARSSPTPTTSTPTTRRRWSRPTSTIRTSTRR